MKKILIILLFCGFWANAQQYHDKGAKFENATNVGDTITVDTRVPIIDEFGLINYYVDVADLLSLNPSPTLEWGNITGTLSDQTDLQGALDDKADQSALTAHTSNGSIHFTQSEIDITESQISDLKDYLRGDVNDTNGSNKLTLGSLEVAGQTTLQNGLTLNSIPTGTSDNILTLNQSTGDVEQRVFSLGDIDIANAAGVSQFPVGLGDQLRIQGSGDTSISFDGVTNTINIHSTPGSGGGGAVTSFNGRDGAVVSQAGDYSTAMVNENTNLYFTEPRVRSTPLTGLTVTNTPISSTNTFIQALGRLQGQINDRPTIASANSDYVNVTGDTMTGTLVAGNGITVTGDHLNLNDFRRVNFGSSQDAYITYDGSGNRLNMVLNSSVADFRILDGSNPIMTIDRLSNNTTFEQTVIGNNGFRAFGSLAPWFDAIVTNNSDSNIFRGRDSNNNTIGSITTRSFNGSGGGYLSLNGEWRINENSFWHSGNLNPSDYYLASNPNGYTSNTGTVTQVSGGTGIIGNVTSSGSLSIDSGYTGFDSRYYTETEADNRFLNSSGGSLSGTTTVTAGHFNLNDFRRLNFGSSQDAYMSYDGSGNRFNMILESSVVDFRILDGVNERFKIDRATGNTNVSGTITASNLSGTNTGDQTAGTGLSGTSTLSITNIAAGSSTVGALRYNGTTKSAGRLYGGTSNPSNSTRLNYDGNFHVNNFTAVGSGSFGGRVSGSDAINANEFVTRQQVVPLSTQQTGVVRAIEAISSALTVDESVYMQKGGSTYSLTVPAGTFQQSGRGIVDIEGIMEMSNITQNKTLLVYITFLQGGIVYDSDPMSFNLSTTGGGAFGHFKATLTSRMSAGYFFGKGIVTGSDANGSITQGFTINPPTALDFRESFTIRMRVNSTTGYNMVLIPFTVKVSDLPN